MNNSKRIYVDFHVLQTVPPSCVNRDDTGSPKTAIYGGVTRARVSSQAWKRAMRLKFQDILSQEDVGQRTKMVIDLVAGQVIALDPECTEKQAQDSANLRKCKRRVFFVSFRGFYAGRFCGNIVI